MFSFIGDIIGCIVWGIAITTLLIGIVIIIPNLLYNRFQLSPGNIVCIILVAFFFLFQSSLLVGGVKTKKYINTAGLFIQSFANENNVNSISSNEVQQICHRLTSQYPVLEKYIEKMESDITSSQTIVRNSADFTYIICHNLKNQINYYIWRRIGWMIMGMIVCLILLYINNKQTHSRTTGRRIYQRQYTPRRIRK